MTSAITWEIGRRTYVKDKCFKHGVFEGEKKKIFLLMGSWYIEHKDQFGTSNERYGGDLDAAVYDYVALEKTYGIDEVDKGEEMGYYTYYRMDILDKDGTADGTVLLNIANVGSLNHVLLDDDIYEPIVKIVRHMMRKHNNEDAYYGLLSEESAKWYDHEEEILELSEEFPDFVFILSGDGEEQGDVWKKHFHNGYVETHVPKMMWPGFNIREFVDAHEREE